MGQLLNITHFQPECSSNASQSRSFDGQLLGSRLKCCINAPNIIVCNRPVVLVHHLDVQVCDSRDILDIPILVPNRLQRVDLNGRTNTMSTSITRGMRKKEGEEIVAHDERAGTYT